MDENSSHIQALLFHKDAPENYIKEFLQNNDYRPIKKVHITENYKRYRITQPNYNKYAYRIINLHKESAKGPKTNNKYTVRAIIGYTK